MRKHLLLDVAAIRTRSQYVLIFQYLLQSRIRFDGRASFGLSVVSDFFWVLDFSMGGHRVVIFALAPLTCHVLVRLALGDGDRFGRDKRYRNQNHGPAPLLQAIPRIADRPRKRA